MGKYIKLFTVAITIAFLSSGCATKIKVKALYPSDIDRAAATKTIAVTEFKNDTIGVGGTFETKIASQKLDGKPYFTVISRTNIDQVLKEQKLQGSGLLDESSSVSIGGLLGAQALISGEVGNVSKDDREYYETRSKCVKYNDKKECISYKKYRVNCVERSVGLNVNIKMVDVSRGDIIYTESFNKNKHQNHCNDSWGSLLSQSQMLNQIVDNITTNFAGKLTPRYVFFEVTLLDSPDIDYSDNQKSKLESGLKLMEKGRYDKAINNFEYLVQSTGERSYVALYNLGVVQEALGNLEDALSLYQNADGLTDDSVDEIYMGIQRVQLTIDKRNKALNQMNRD